MLLVLAGDMIIDSDNVCQRVSAPVSDKACQGECRSPLLKRTAVKSGRLDSIPDRTLHSAIDVYAEADQQYSKANTVECRHMPAQEMNCKLFGSALDHEEDVCGSVGTSLF